MKRKNLCGQPFKMKKVGRKDFLLLA